MYKNVTVVSIIMNHPLVKAYNKGAIKAYRFQAEGDFGKYPQKRIGGDLWNFIISLSGGSLLRNLLTHVHYLNECISLAMVNKTTHATIVSILNHDPILRNKVFRKPFIDYPFGSNFPQFLGIPLKPSKSARCLPYKSRNRTNLKNYFRSSDYVCIVPHYARTQHGSYNRYSLNENIQKYIKRYNKANEREKKELRMLFFNSGKKLKVPNS